MEFFRINKWEKHQHYHDRRPPWLKFYTTINDDDSLWRGLSDTELGQVARVFAYAGTCDNTMPFHAELIKEQLDLTNDIDLAKLVKLNVIEVFKDRKSCLAIENARLNARQKAGKKREKISPKNVEPLVQSSEVEIKSTEVDEEKSPPSPKRAAGVAGDDPVKEFPPEAHQLAKILAQGMIDNDPKAKIPTTQRQKDGWLKAIDMIHRTDGRDWDEIEAVIRWCQQDNFWHRNILSGPKLRKKFQRLALEMKADTGAKQGRSTQLVNGSKAALADYFKRRDKNGQVPDGTGGPGPSDEV